MYARGSIVEVVTAYMRVWPIVEVVTVYMRVWPIVEVVTVCMRVWSIVEVRQCVRICGPLEKCGIVYARVAH